MNKFTIIGLLFFAGSLNAAPITWTLDNVYFETGDSATGSFDYDATTNQFSNVLIDTSGDSGWAFAYPGSLYLTSAVDPGSDSSHLFITGSLSDGFSVLTQLNLMFTSALTNAGGVVALDTLSNEYVENANFNIFATRLVTSGSVSAIPIPAAAWLFGSALSGLGWMRRKQFA